MLPIVACLGRAAQWTLLRVDGLSYGFCYKSGLVILAGRIRNQCEIHTITRGDWNIQRRICLSRSTFLDRPVFLRRQAHRLLEYPGEIVGIPIARLDCYDLDGFVAQIEEPAGQPHSQFNEIGHW